jgi:treble-clef zinc-finger protein
MGAMDALSERQIRGSFVNTSKGTAARINLPPDLEELPWADLDLLGWVDARSPLSGYLVVPTPTYGVVGMALRRATGGGSRRTRMCSLCATTHSGQGVSLMVAARAGRAGRDGNSVGGEMCTSLACSGYARGLLAPPSLSAVHETLSVEGRVARLQRNVLAFVERVLRP